MKLTKFNSISFPKGQSGGRSSSPKVSFTKTGLITFNKKAVELLGIKEGDNVSLCQDEEEPNNWFVAKEKEGFSVRDVSGNKVGTLSFNHKELVNTFLNCFGHQVGITHSFLLAGQPTTIEKTKYWGILVSTTV